MPFNPGKLPDFRAGQPWSKVSAGEMRNMASAVARCAAGEGGRPPQGWGRVAKRELDTDVAFLLVKVALDGGDPGSETTPCTFKYSIFPYWTDHENAANVLAVNLTPYIPRTPVGKYTAAPDGSFAWAGFITDPISGQKAAWVLWLAMQELPFTEACT